MEEKDTDTFEGNVYDGITCEGGVCYGRRYLSCFLFPGPGGEYASWEGDEGHGFVRRTPPGTGVV